MNSDRCPHGFLAGLCVLATCEHYDGGGSVEPPQRVAPTRCDSLPPKVRHHAFVDMTGQTLAGCRVLRQAANSPRGVVQWLMIGSCGHRFVDEGTKLRHYARRRRIQMRCHKCRRTRGAL